MAKELKLIAKRAFHAWGVSYNPGDVVDASEWPSDEALPNRLRGGDVAHEVATEEPAETPVLPDLESLNKTELAAYAADTFGLDLSMDLTKAVMIATIHEAAAE